MTSPWYTMLQAYKNYFQWKKGCSGSLETQELIQSHSPGHHALLLDRGEYRNEFEDSLSNEAVLKVLFILRLSLRNGELIDSSLD